MPSLRLLLSVVVASGLGLAACDRKPDAATQKDSAEAKVMATVNGEKILESDFQNYLRLRQQQVGPVPDKDKEIQLVLNEMIEKALLAQYATKNKLDADPEVSSLIKRVREEILVQAVKRQVLHDKPITDEDVKKRFEQEVENTHKTEYKVRHILVQDEAGAKEILAQLAKGAKFEKLAKAKSEDAQSRNNGGELGWINQGMVVPEFFDAIKTMKKGDVSRTPVKTEFGWHIIKVDNTRPLEIPSFEEFMSDQRARASLYRKLQDERVAELIKQLKDQAKIETP